MLHTIKILESYADAIVDGRKNFEVRLNDRGYNAGDEVAFIIKDDHDFTNLVHPLNNRHFKITYVHSGLGLQDGYVVFGIAEECNTSDRNIIEQIRNYGMIPVIEVVHCGECKYADPKNLFCTLHLDNPTESDYCSWGERE